MKSLLVLLVSIGIVLLAGLSFAAGGTISLTSNASPVIVDLVTDVTHEVTFPQVVRHVSVFNYDVDDGLWINFRGGDTRGIDGISSRFYLGPSSVVTLNDFMTSAITLVRDSQFTGGGASPVSVIGLY